MSGSTTSPTPSSGALDRIVGHAGPKERFGRLLADDRLAHAYLFHGDEGIGKHAFAEALAATCLQTRDVRGRDDIGRLVDHPDYWALDDPSVAVLSIDAVRSLIEVAGRKPVHATGRVFVVRDAERFSEEAQNALLKTLEEPPARCLILLTTAEPERLLPTIRSRCQSVRFGVLTAEETAVVLRGAGCDDGRAALLAAVAGGAPGGALAIESAGLLEDRAELLRLLSGEIADGLGWAETRYQGFKKSDAGVRRMTTMLVGTWLGVLRDLAAASTGAGSGLLWNRDLSAQIDAVAAAAATETHTERVDRALEALVSLSINTSPDLVLSDLALKLCSSR